MFRGEVSHDTWAIMNKTAPAMFSAAMRYPGGTEIPQLQQGIRSAVASAQKPEDIASGIATAYDQTILSIAAGMLVSRPALNITRSSTIQVTRIPRAPFVTIIMLDIAYAAIGTCLAIAALFAVQRGRGVRDAQARLSTLAVVAESFESPAWGDDARDVDMLFAERRGESTRRIALARRKGGGRRFKQIVIAQDNIKISPKAAAPGSKATGLV